MNKKEIFYINYLKFFGIIYLLIWHTGIRKINVFVILFFIQMFIFISGYFYKDKYSNAPVSFIKKRIKSLYIPYIFYCSLFLALNNIFVKINFYSNNLYIDPIKYGHHFLQILLLNNSQQMAGAMWFVASLFSISILFLLISKISISLSLTVRNFNIREYVRFFIVLSLYITGYYFSYIKCKLPALLDVSFVLLIFYYCGFLYRKYEHKIPLNLFLAIISFFALLFCMKFGFPLIIQRKYINLLFLIFCGLAGTYLNIYLANKCASIKMVKFVNYAGKNTMAILALHFLAFKSVSIFIIYTHNIPINLLSSFPIIRESSQFYRWVYVSSGLILPLLAIYIFDTIILKFKSLMDS